MERVTRSRKGAASNRCFIDSDGPQIFPAVFADGGVTEAPLEDVAAQAPSPPPADHPRAPIGVPA